ncbi:PhoH family protein [Desulfobacca acetoxidans]|uniref:PhoH family protein n=1 Tax=Desulfobacca acetoxidans (strain ATCC 700848 / DSM 11109 / ASRB2) TaxID=880072 RepID=F2NE49_DESAR|nr:PhoH family protein [Desulfobacca acetoxidans]AEB10679.1 PhoH family protein [Desulfobacca acetoxidans DSM 11109]
MSITLLQILQTTPVRGIVGEVKKNYILDTNVLLHDPGSIFAFEDNDIILPVSVIEELDKQKTRSDEIGRHAREVSRQLDGLRSLGPLSGGVRLPQGGSIRIELNCRNTFENACDIDLNTTDNRILALAFHLQQCTDEPVILVTKDLNLRIKADVLGLKAEDFYSDKVDYPKLYAGVGELVVSEAELEGFFKQGAMEWPGNGLAPHQFCILKSAENPSQSALARYFQGRLRKLSLNGLVYGLKALNKEQKFALELLLDDGVKIVTLVGKAGTGKTILALAAGLEKVFEESAGYNRLLITRPIVPLGNDLGYLPGDKEEKIRPWMQPIYDNLEFLCNEHIQANGCMDYLFNTGKIELEVLTYIRGRSIPRQFIICDESQNLSPHAVKTILTRVGRGSKIIFTGDPEQIDHPYLDASSNGLSYLVDRIKGEEISGHVTLIKGERSGIAELGARLL